MRSAEHQKKIAQWNMRQHLEREAKRNKICVWCKVAYVDTTKRLVGKTCSQACASTLMVSKRHLNDTYKHSPEQNALISAALKTQYETGRRSRIPSSAINKLRTASQEERQLYAKKRQKTCQEKYGHAHWSKTPEGRKKISQIHKGRTVSVATRKKLSENARKQTHRFSRCRGGFRKDLGLYVRSSWEANYARYLNKQGVKWKYEPQTFDLGDGYTYTPDFQLEDGSFVELKGWLTEKGKFKLERFFKTFPAIRLVLIQRNEYRKIYNEHKTTTENWEHTQ